MMRLIDAEPIEKHIQDGLNQRREESFGYVGAQIMNEIRCAPTIDAVEVIRCRDCKYMRGSKLNDSKWCAIYGNDFGWVGISLDDYCSCGKRNSGEEYRNKNEEL